LRFAGETLARGGEQHPAGATLEQLDFELLLERLDLSAERGLTDVQFVRGSGEVAELGDGDKAA
jgi:hypothetical protein